MPLKPVKEDDDPQRCQAPSLDGQCRNLQEEGHKYCLVHGGVVSDGQEALRLYMLANADDNAKLNKMVSHSGLKSLREEITLARILLEKIWNSIEGSSSDVLRASGQINAVLLTIERLVRSASALEEKTGVMLDKATVAQIAKGIGETLLSELKGVPNYEQIIDNINARVSAIVADAQNTPTEN